MILLIMLFTMSMIALYGMIKSIRHEKQILKIEKLLYNRIQTKHSDLADSYKTMKEELLILRTS